jgi:hypothetical protein
MGKESLQGKRQEIQAFVALHERVVPDIQALPTAYKEIIIDVVTKTPDTAAKLIQEAQKLDSSTEQLPKTFANIDGPLVEQYQTRKRNETRMATDGQTEEVFAPYYKAELVKRLARIEIILYTRREKIPYTEEADNTIMNLCEAVARKLPPTKKLDREKFKFSERGTYPTENGKKIDIKNML